MLKVLLSFKKISQIMIGTVLIVPEGLILPTDALKPYKTPLTYIKMLHLYAHPKKLHINFHKISYFFLLVCARFH